MTLLIKEELVKEKVKLSMNDAEDKRVQNQLKRSENTKTEKQAALEKAKRLLQTPER